MKVDSFVHDKLYPAICELTTSVAADRLIGLNIGISAKEFFQDILNRFRGGFTHDSSLINLNEMCLWVSLPHDSSKSPLLPTFGGGLSGESDVDIWASNFIASTRNLADNFEPICQLNCFTDSELLAIHESQVIMVSDPKGRECINITLRTGNGDAESASFRIDCADQESVVNFGKEVLKTILRNILTKFNLLLTEISVIRKGLKSLKSLWRRTDVSNLPRMCQQAANIAFYCKSYELATSLYKSAAEDNCSAGLNRQTADCYLVLGILNSLKGLPDGIQFFDKSIVLYSTVPLPLNRLRNAFIISQLNSKNLIAAYALESAFQAIDVPLSVKPLVHTLLQNQFQSLLKSRKSAFQLVLAAHSYRDNGQPRVATSAYQKSLENFTGKSWKNIEQHLGFSLSKQYFASGDLETSNSILTDLLNKSTELDSNLRGLSEKQRNYIKGLSAIAKPVDLQIPKFELIGGSSLTVTNNLSVPIILTDISFLFYCSGSSSHDTILLEPSETETLSIGNSNLSEIKYRLDSLQSAQRVKPVLANPEPPQIYSHGPVLINTDSHQLISNVSPPFTVVVNYKPVQELNQMLMIKYTVRNRVPKEWLLLTVEIDTVDSRSDLDFFGKTLITLPRLQSSQEASFDIFAVATNPVVANVPNITITGYIEGYLRSYQVNANRLISFS
jgi:tetratricopeptide (TPR) repeat protein